MLFSSLVVFCLQLAVYCKIKVYIVVSVLIAREGGYIVLTQVGERVGIIRKDHKLSRAQFGKMIGVSEQYVGMLERGVYKISIDLITKICHMTGVSADYILFGVASHLNDSAETLIGLSSEQIEIGLDILKRLAVLINTADGNEALIQEVTRQLHSSATE